MKSLICMILFSQLTFAADKSPSDVTAEFIKKYDFSEELVPRSEFLGFIDPKFQRLFIKFKSVKKDPSNASIYLVEGTSKVKNNTCNFSGKIKVTLVEKITPMHYGVDDSYKNKGIKSEGVLQGDYEFTEDKKEKYSGVFKGSMVMYWFVDKKGRIEYDNIEEDVSDSYANNQYAGTWTEHGKTVGKRANWGEHRIPNSDDLDIGAAEFAADPKYSGGGW